MLQLHTCNHSVDAIMTTLELTDKSSPSGEKPSSVVAGCMTRTFSNAMCSRTVRASGCPEVGTQQLKPALATNGKNPDSIFPMIIGFSLSALLPHNTVQVLAYKVEQMCCQIST